jgi:transcriptional regulator with XRE-family HTH domain
VAPPRRSQSKSFSQLTKIRILRGVSQEQLADAVGVSYKTIERLEANKIADPSFRLLNNCALALGVKVEQIIEPSLRDWFVFKTNDPEKRRPAPPDPAVFFQRGKLKMPRWVEELVVPPLSD